MAILAFELLKCWVQGEESALNFQQMYICSCCGQQTRVDVFTFHFSWGCGGSFCVDKDGTCNWTV